jgi:hypothetical protein
MQMGNIHKKALGCSYLLSLYHLICGHCSKSMYSNFIRLTPLMVARSWHINGLDGILSKQPQTRIHVLPSPYLSLPLMSIVKIARYFYVSFQIKYIIFYKIWNCHNNFCAENVDGEDHHNHHLEESHVPFVWR